MISTKRVCGTCTLCCFTHGVSSRGNEEFRKPAHEWCTHCHIDSGCGIYEKRPEACREFSCAWLQGQFLEQERPDVTKVVVHQFKSDFYRVLRFHESEIGAINQAFSREALLGYMKRNFIVLLLRIKEEAELLVFEGTYLTSNLEEWCKKNKIKIIHLPREE